MKKIIFIHLLNDYSGSPKVLSQVINAVQKKGYEVELYTGKSEDGFLTDITPNHHYYFYKRFDNKLLTLISFILSQIDLFFKLLKYRNEDVTVYINTMLPFGAALFGKFLKKEVYYHVHETSLRPKLLKKFLRFIIQYTASKIIFVSNFLKESESFKDIEQEVIYNVLSNEFVIEASKSSYQWKDSDGKFNVLMICSLKAYKGIDEFIEIAKLCEDNRQIGFTLILNAEKKEINDYFASIGLPSSVTILDKQKDLHPYYKEASLVLNLSRVDQWVETFGLTILEAMSYGIPCIVPPVGGPAEIVQNRKDGYLISSYKIDKVFDIIINLSLNKEKCIDLSYSAKQKSLRFNTAKFNKEILRFIDE
jgi:glycosyltransferase involved in cell wall biosynthesis